MKRIIVIILTIIVGFFIPDIVTSTRDYVVFDSVTGIISFYCEGKKNDFPTICDDMVGKNIDELCEGLREAMNEIN